MKTQYVYDGRGSVAQSVVNGQAQSHAYTPFGEMLTGKQSGFGFNAEWYDAATGMQNLRVRQYEPAMMRFSRKDILRGRMVEPLSLNRYLYVVNDPVNLIDPNGMEAFSLNWARGQLRIIEAAMSDYEKAQAEASKLKRGTKEANAAYAKRDSALARANDAALAVYSKLKEHEAELSGELLDIYLRTKKLIGDRGKKTKFSADDLARMRAMCKMMFANEEDKSYDPNKPINITVKDPTKPSPADYGTHYSQIPQAFLLDAAIQMAANPDFVSKKSGMAYDPKTGVWAVDCISAMRIIAKSWMDKDVFDFYVAEGKIGQKVSSQYGDIAGKNKGTIEYDPVTNALRSDLPVGTLIFYDKNNDEKGDTHVMIYLGNDEEGNSWVFSSPGGQFGNLLSIHMLDPTTDKLYGKTGAVAL